MKTIPSQVAPDRHGNPRFSDQQQIAFLDFYLDHFVGFQGTIYERGVIAEAWWMGDWSPKGRCPSLEEAKALLAGAVQRAVCDVHGDEHIFAFVKEYEDGQELWRCACSVETFDARERGLRIDAEDESEWEGRRLADASGMHT